MPVRIWWYKTTIPPMGWPDLYLGGKISSSSWPLYFFPLPPSILFFLPLPFTSNEFSLLSLLLIRYWCHIVAWLTSLSTCSLVKPTVQRCWKLMSIQWSTSPAKLCREFPCWTFSSYHPNDPYSALVVHAETSASAANTPNPGDDNGPSREVHEVWSPLRPSATVSLE